MKVASYYLPAIFWGLIILVLTLTPGAFFPKINYWSPLSLDKYVHFAIFFVQVWLLLVSGKKQYAFLQAKNYGVFILIGTVFGIFIEFIQTQIPARSFEWNDMVANAIGAVLGGMVFYVTRRPRPST